MTNEELGSRRRRRILETGAAALVGIAGCPTTSENKNPTSTSTESPTGTDEPTETATETPDGPSQEFLDDLLETNNQNMNRAYEIIPAPEDYTLVSIDDWNSQRKIAEDNGLDFTYDNHKKIPTGQVGVKSDNLHLSSKMFADEVDSSIIMLTYDLEEPEAVEEELKNEYEITKMGEDFWRAYHEEFELYWTFNSKTQTWYYDADGKEGLEIVKETVEDNHPTVAEADNHRWPGSPPYQENIITSQEIGNALHNGRISSSDIRNIADNPNRETVVVTFEYGKEGATEQLYSYNTSENTWDEHRTKDRKLEETLLYLEN